MATRVQIPERSVYEASEVCAIAELQPFVLRSWETEFPDLGVARGKGRARTYRREDLDRVLRIKELVFSEGLTLGAARRRLLKEARAAENPGTPALKAARRRVLETVRVREGAGTPPLGAAPGDDVRARLDGIKKGLHAILDLLAGQKA